MELWLFVTTHNYFWFHGHFYLQNRRVAMGAKFAPSLANHFMAKWEKGVVYAHRTPEFVLWARYTDYILFLWHGIFTIVHEIKH